MQMPQAVQTLIEPMHGAECVGEYITPESRERACRPLIPGATRVAARGGAIAFRV